MVRVEKVYLLVLVCAWRISRAIFISRLQHRLIVFFSSIFFSFGAVVVVTVSVLADEFLARTVVLSRVVGRVCVRMSGSVASSDVVLNADPDGIAVVLDETNGQTSSETMAKEPVAVLIKLILMRQLV
ncbi:hypothetical protein CWM47_23965 [Spirosoma pollinicola]|uniref:Uncharacterized protein n=1 Tax=Spirosoma pollinicola TaxID=2057025 RepID=A0A2K8Z445_9BACT|nr:hypothetical protein CWM47_23965 [Spirosoma pollinicola]